MPSVSVISVDVAKRSIKISVGDHFEFMPKPITLREHFHRLADQAADEWDRQNTRVLSETC